MTLKIYLKLHPEIQRFYLQSKDRRGGPDAFCECESSNFDDLNHFGNYKIKKIEESPDGEDIMTIFI